MKKNKLRNHKSKRKVKIVNLKWNKRDIALENGGYYIGIDKKYFLSEDALNHIINGDFTSRQLEKNEDSSRNMETILKGGLHTYNAWINFKNIRNDVVHLKIFDSNKHKFWYYARTLNNGVITLKVPKDLFQSKAANLTKYPDTYYKSGYLWKTLFPKEKTTSDILSIIDEALFNLNKEESQIDKLLIGYALVEHPYTMMKIRIQVSGDNQINSAFPTWEQPNTGNTGKAYSHIDTIGFVIAWSTEFFDDIEVKEKDVSNLDIETILKDTPKFLLDRPKLPKIGELVDWTINRKNQLIQIVEQCNEEDIIIIQQYLEKSLICKNGYVLQSSAYEELFDILKTNREVFNSIFISQNIVEVLSVIFYYDQTHKTFYFIDSMQYLLQNKINYTGALDSWNNKVLHNKILDFVIDYHDARIISIYIDNLAKSPIRSSLYLEFDLANVCYKKEFNLLDEEESDLFSLQNLPIDNYVIQAKYFKDFLALNLSENYFINFNEDQRDTFIDKIMKNLGKNFEKMVFDVVTITESKDFQSFQEKFEILIKKIISLKLEVSSSSFKIIIKDFFRIQTAQRMKIFLRKQDFKLDAMYYFDYDSEEYKLHTIVKHERRMNVWRLERFLEDSLELSNYLNDTKMSEEILKYQKLVWTERPPISKGIPNYIKHWANQKDKSWKNTVDIIRG